MIEIYRKIQRLFWVRVPKSFPKDTILVLTVMKGKITGWQTPDSARERNVWFARGVSFIFVSQSDIDQFIPAHSPEIDEEEREQREYREQRE